MDTPAKASPVAESPTLPSKTVFIDLPPEPGLPTPSKELARASSSLQTPQLLIDERRIPALDGVRGVAVLLVLLFHFMDIGYPRFLGPLGTIIFLWGWTGVDLFFVLSGFLITGILYDAKGLPGYFSSFYGRRAVRIFPPYFLLVAVVLYAIPAAWPWLFQKGELFPYGPHWMYWTYLTNYYFARDNAYGNLGHTWSLCVEEQFYLAWPLVVMLLNRRRLIAACVGVFIGSLALRYILLARGGSIWEVYLFTFTRVDELAMGAFVALMVRSQRGVVFLKRVRWLALVAPVGVAGLWVVKKKFPEHGEAIENALKFTFVGMFFATMLGMIITTPQTNLMNRTLRMGWLRWFGRYSYGLYLYHVPLCETVKEYMGRHVTGLRMYEEYAIFAFGSIALALLSWHGLEKHMLKLKRYFPMPTRRASLAADATPTAVIAT